MIDKGDSDYQCFADGLFVFRKHQPGWLVQLSFQLREFYESYWFVKINHSLVTAKVKREIKRWPKSENEALRDDVAAGRRRLHIRSICPSPREATTASGVDNAAPTTGRHRWTGLFPLSERGLSLCKNNCREPRSILMNSADELPISMGNYCEQYTRASSGV